MPKSEEELIEELIRQADALAADNAYLLQRGDTYFAMVQMMQTRAVESQWGNFWTQVAMAAQAFELQREIETAKTNTNALIKRYNALAFYADPAAWRWSGRSVQISGGEWVKVPETSRPIDRDAGQRAREALGR